MAREATPLQEAKRLGLPYVKIVIDRRHVDGGGGRVEFEGPVAPTFASASHNLLREIINSPDDTQEDGR